LQNSKPSEKTVLQNEVTVVGLREDSKEFIKEFVQRHGLQMSLYLLPSFFTVTLDRPLLLELQQISEDDGSLAFKLVVRGKSQSAPQYGVYHIARGQVEVVSEISGIRRPDQQCDGLQMAAPRLLSKNEVDKIEKISNYLETEQTLRFLRSRTLSNPIQYPASDYEGLSLLHARAYEEICNLGETKNGEQELRSNDGCDFRNEGGKAP
jgi:hypothetical protein